MPLNINMHILYFFYSWYSFWYAYIQSNEWKTDQPNKEVTDRQKTTVVDFVTAERTNAGVQMYEYACIFESTAPWSIQKAKSHNGSS